MLAKTPSRSGRSAAVLLVVLLAACSGGGGSSGGSTGPTPPAAPTGVAALGSNLQNWITWPAVTGATSYNLYWSTTAGVTKANGAKIAGVASGYVHAGLTNGTPYYYVVTAANAGGESAASAQVTATPQPAGSRNVRISWDANHERGVNKAGGYYGVSTNGGASWQYVDYVSGSLAPTFADTVLPTGSYSARVAACQALDDQGGTTADACSTVTTFTLNVP